MIPLKGKLAIIDNSGALLAECINVLKNKSSFGLATVGDEITVVVKRARPLVVSPNASASLVQKVKRGDVRRAVIVRTKKSITRPDGTSIRFDDNAAVLINNKKEPVGSRVNGVVAAEVRNKGWSRIASLATKIV